VAILLRRVIRQNGIFGEHPSSHQHSPIRRPHQTITRARIDTMNTRWKELGGLSCQVADGRKDKSPPSLAVILCHGYGAPGTDLVPLSWNMSVHYPELANRVVYVFPSAPYSLEDVGLFEGRAWWQVDIGRLSAAIERGELRRASDELPDDMLRSREKLAGLVEEVKSEYQVPTAQIILGGFSQGSILATDVALRLPESPAALCIWSGTLMCEDQWSQLAAQRRETPVLQSHGRNDPLLPFQAAIWLRDMLVAAGMNVDFHEFAGDHTIPLEVLEKFGMMMDRLIIEK
jgi:phospholipase/carboxylesterase